MPSVLSKEAQAAAKWIATLEQDDGIASYITVSEVMTQRDPHAAAAFCAQMPQYSDHGSTDHVFLALANKDPAAAVETLMSGKFSDQLKDRCLPSVIGDWLAHDAHAAREFINAQPPSEVIGVIMLQASHILTDGDVNSAREFALALPAPALRLGACRRILQDEFLRDDSLKPKAAEWIAAIPDPALRTALAQSLSPPE